MAVNPNTKLQAIPLDKSGNFIQRVQNIFHFCSFATEICPTISLETNVFFIIFVVSLFFVTVSFPFISNLCLV